MVCVLDLTLAVETCVMLAGLLGMVGCVVEVTFRDVRMMAGFFMVASFVMVGGGMVLFGGVFVVLRRLAMVMDGFFGHVQLLFAETSFGGDQVSKYLRSSLRALCDGPMAGR